MDAEVATGWRDRMVLEMPLEAQERLWRWMADNVVHRRSW